VSALTSFLFYVILYQDLEWDVVNMKFVAESNWFSTYTFACIRMCFGLIILASLIHSTVLEEENKMAVLDRKGESKNLTIKPLMRMTFFTYWAWMLEGIYFMMAGLLSLYAASGTTIPETFLNQGQLHIILRIVWVLYEVTI
jgi:hypothetical protein